MEEGFDGDAGAVGAETFVVLAVTFFLGVSGIEAGDTVEVVAAVFAQGVTEGEAEVAPGGIVAGDVFSDSLDALGDDFDVVFGEGGSGCGLRCMLGSELTLGFGPFFWIECLFHYLVAYLGFR